MNEELTKELIEMEKKDQEMRNKWSETGNWDSNIDLVNTKRIKEIVRENGWPTISKVGKAASSAAWVLVQHADGDPKFQEECLELMKKAENGDVLKKEIAYLEDRVRVNTGKPQLYGTQFYNDEKGTFGPRPIEDVENIEKRRQEMGFKMSFEDYKKTMLESNKNSLLNRLT